MCVFPHCVDNGASRCYTEMTDFSPPQTIFSLSLWMQFELILAWQITSEGPRTYDFYAQNAILPHCFRSLRSIFNFNQNVNKNVAKNLLKYNNRQHVKWFYSWTLKNVVCLVTWHLLPFYGICAGHFLYVITCI